MKKYLAIITCMIFVLGFAAAAFAIHAEIPVDTQSVVAKGETQITIGGDIRTRGEIKHETFQQVFDAVTGDFLRTDTDKHDKSGYDQRVRLDVTANVGPNVTGMIQLESTRSDLDNNSVGADVYTWGTNAAGTGIYTAGNAKQSDMSILQAWILYKTDFLGLKVGHMPLYLGNKLFFDHSRYGDDAIVVFATPTKGLDLGVLTIKFQENGGAGSFGSNSKDQDGYVAYGNYVSDVFNAGADVTWVDINSGSSFGAGASSNVYNAGLRGGAKIGPFGVRGDVEWQWGKLFKGTIDEQTVKGYAALLGVDLTLGPIKLMAEGARGSGDKDFTDGDFKTFITALGADQHFTYVYDYRIIGATGLQYAGLANTTYGKLGVSGNITKDLSFYAAGFWLQASEDVAINGATNLDGTLNKSKNLGIEGDAKITYALAKNLNYWIEGGYFMLGDAYKAGNVATPGVNKDPDDVWDVRQGIQLSF